MNSPVAGWRTRLTSAALLVAGSAVLVRAAAWLLAPLLPYLIVAGCLAGLYLFVFRRSQ